MSFNARFLNPAHLGRSAIKAAGILAVALGLTACGTTNKDLAPAPITAGQQDYNYIIGPGDTLNVVVWRNPDLTMSGPVRPDGKFAAPLVDEVYVQGKSSVQVARDLEKALSKYVRDPVVTVLVTGFVGPYSEQVRVLGEATRPQALPFKNKMTVLDVMIAVGGLTDFADGNGARIIRASEGNKQYALRLKDLIRRGDVSANVEVRPGDVILIPQSLF